MSDSTKSDNIDLLDAGSARWQLKTHYLAATDEHTPEVVSIDWEHQLTHEGQLFQLSGQIASLGAGATAYLHGLTGSSQVHFRAASVVIDGAPADFVFYEDSTIAVNGSGLTAYNKNRNSANTSSLSLYSGPTVTTPGTALEYGFVPVQGPGHSGGLADMFSSEWVLQPDMSYLIAMTNNDNSAIKINYNFLWYEIPFA